MRAVSATSVNHDPYRAGMALGETLGAVEPEVVFLFSSIHFAAPDLIEGLYDGLGRDDVIVVGNSGDGCFESSGVFDYGAAALGLNSDGRVSWRLDRVGDLNDNLERKLEGLISRLSEGELPRLAYLVSDFRVDPCVVEATLNRTAAFPIVGGLAMDDRKGAACFIYANREVTNDVIVMLAAYGDLEFSLAVGNSQPSVGHPGRIEAASSHVIDRIDGVTAAEFIERETGKPVLQTDRGVLSVRISGPNGPNEARLRSIMLKATLSSGSLGFFGGVNVGETVQACQADPEIMLNEIRRIAGHLSGQGSEPAAALIVSCTGRKAFLGPLIEREVNELKQAFSPGLPIAGFPSRGEIAPLPRGEGYTRNLFHNMTCATVVFWR